MEEFHKSTIGTYVPYGVFWGQ